MNKIVLAISLIFIQSNYFILATENTDKLLAVSVNGINRHYALGQWLRNRYSTFLANQYSLGEILVRSTDVDRTLMSAAANLAGLYPPHGDQVWNKDLPWRPIPIHTLKKTEDEVLAMKKSCPKLDELYDQNRNSDFYQEVDREHSELYAFVSERSGLNVTSLDGIKLVRSVFYCYRNFNFSFVPSWGDSLNQTELDYLAGLAYARNSATDDMKRLRAGPFLNYLIDYFYDVANGVEDKLKFLMFSSHDTELVSVLDSMGVYDGYPPGFAATIIWELKENAEGKRYLNLFYRKSEDELLELTVPGCKFYCQLDDFRVILEPFTVNTTLWKKECKTDEHYYKRVGDSVGK